MLQTEINHNTQRFRSLHKSAKTLPRPTAQISASKLSELQKRVKLFQNKSTEYINIDDLKEYLKK